MTSFSNTTDYYQGHFIAGLCRIWCRRTTGENRYWQHLCYPNRGWHACVRIVEDFMDRFPGEYDYEVTADQDIMRPCW